MFSTNILSVDDLMNIYHIGTLKNLEHLHIKISVIDVHLSSCR